MKLTATIIAAAFAFTAAPTTASQFCAQLSNYARSAAAARDAGVSEDDLIAVVTKAEKAHPNPGLFVATTAVAHSAYDEVFMWQSPRRFAFKVYQVCEQNNWEAKYGN